jgi:hypothetical protein
METDIDRLILLFDSFSVNEQAEAIRRLNEYIQGNAPIKQRIVRESNQRNNVRKMNVGPTGSICPCCGK